MRLQVIDPLAILGAMNGLRRPLDRGDFKGGHIPDWAGRYTPKAGIIDALGWGGPGYHAYQGLNANLGVIAGENASGSDMYSFGTKQYHPLGTVAFDRSGRVFRYCSAGATALVEGSLYQSAAPIALHLALTSAAQNIGDGTGKNPIVVTPGATAGAANLYAEGTLMVDTTPNNGYTYGIASHPAITASTAFNLFLYPDDVIQTTAWTTATRYGLHHNPYKTIIVAATTVTALAVGGAVINITGNGTSENFGWLQTRGPFAALINGTPAVGTALVTSATTAGAVDVATFTTTVEISGRFIARAMQVGVSGKNNAVFLLLD